MVWCSDVTAASNCPRASLIRARAPPARARSNCKAFSGRPSATASAFTRKASAPAMSPVRCFLCASATAGDGGSIVRFQSGLPLADSDNKRTLGGTSNERTRPDAWVAAVKGNPEESAFNCRSRSPMAGLTISLSRRVGCSTHAGPGKSFRHPEISIFKGCPTGAGLQAARAASNRAAAARLGILPKDACLDSSLAAFTEATEVRRRGLLIPANLSRPLVGV